MNSRKLIYLINMVKEKYNLHVVDHGTDIWYNEKRDSKTPQPLSLWEPHKDANQAEECLIALLESPDNRVVAWEEHGNLDGVAIAPVIKKEDRFETHYTLWEASAEGKTRAKAICKMVLKFEAYMSEQKEASLER